MDSPDHPPPPSDPDRLIYGGLFALAQATVFQLAGKSLSPPLAVAVGSFALAIPLLGACVLGSISRSRSRPPRPPSRFAAIVGLVAATLPVIGFGAFLLDFGWPFLVAYLAAITIAFATVRRM